MASQFERYSADLEKLIKKGAGLFAVMSSPYYKPDQFPEVVLGLVDPKALPDFMSEYQEWYSESLRLIKQLLPERADDFQSFYKAHHNRKTIDPGTYTISDYLRGLSTTQYGKTVADGKSAVLPMLQQFTIVKGLEQRFKSTLYDIKTLVHAEILDDELGAAAELNSKGFQRGAGAVAGVVLEGHLAAVCEQHAIAIRKKDPAISDLNDALKSASAIETATWRFIQHLGDLRNKCDHKKGTEPTKEEVNELIDGVRKITKTVF